MSKLPKDDHKLVDFIRQNCPEVPPTNQDLEAKIMAAVAATTPSEPVKPSPVMSWRRRSLWLMPPAIAASLLIGWGTNQLLTPVPLTATELASLEYFIENTWDEAIEPDRPDWYLDF